MEDGTLLTIEIEPGGFSKEFSESTGHIYVINAHKISC